MNNRSTLALYLVVWMALGLMLAALLAIPGPLSWPGALALSLPMMVVYAFMSLSAWYICRAFPLHRTPPVRLLVVLVLAAILSTALWVGLWFAWGACLAWIDESFLPSDALTKAVPLLAATGVVLFLLASAVTYLIAIFESSRTAERTALELEVLTRDAELKALRAQLDPHFLFNSLNSISALTSSDPAAARVMTVKLADFLRLSLTYGALETITLDQELSLILRFLEIEKVRFGQRLSIDTQVDEGCRVSRMLPLLLQPLVENAVSHGIAHRLEGGTITITARVIGSRLCITITNPVEPEQAGMTTGGVGLLNVRQRLQRMYGSEAAMEAGRHDGQFVVSVLFPVTG